MVEDVCELVSFKIRRPGQDPLIPRRKGVIWAAGGGCVGSKRV